VKPKVVVFGYTELVPQTLALLNGMGIEVPLIVVPRNREGEEVDLVLKEASIQKIPCIRHHEPDPGTFIEALRALQPDLGISASYSHIISRKIFEIPRRGFVNLHGSLLPRYRGPHTLNWQIIKGETEGGVTLHYMDEGLDTGDVIDQASFPIRDWDVAQDVKPRIDRASIQLLRQNLGAILEGSAPRHPQDPAEATCFQARRPEDGRIDFSWSVLQIYNFIRALAAPYPGAFYDIEGARTVLTAYQTIGWVAALKKRHVPLDGLCDGTLSLYPVKIETTGSLALSLQLEERRIGEFIFEPLELGRHRGRLGWKGDEAGGTVPEKATTMALAFARRELELQEIETSGLRLRP
jgi:methionyl-tRNA formyltransferase